VEKGIDLKLFLLKINIQMISKTLTNTFLYIFLISLSNSSLAQQYVISGFIEDKTNGEKLINAIVYSNDKKHNVLSNNYGFYSLKIPEGETEICYSYVGFATQKRLVNLSKDTIINIRMEPDANLEEVTITGIRKEINGKIEINPVKLKLLPIMMGETDVLKTLQYYPGVQAGMEGRSGLYVRGGGPDQNLILLDGVPVYNANHLFGFFSVFNPDAISSVSLYKSDIPAQYGGCLSSVLDIQMKEGNNKEWKGDFTLGLIASKLTIEGPIKKDKSSIVISLRRTYLDILLKPYLIGNRLKTGLKTNGGYYFEDINIKLNYKFSESSHLYLSIYTGKDKAYMDDNYKSQPEITNRDNNSLKWGNLTTVLRWNYVFNNKLFSNTDISYSRYQYQTKIESEITSNTASGDYTDAFNYKNFSGVYSYAQNTKFDYFLNASHHFQFGFGNTYFVFKPGSIKYDQNMGSDSTQNTKVEYINANVYAYKLNLYASDEINFKKLKLNIGVHYSGFMHKNKYYQNIEPRLGAEFSVTENVFLNLSYNKMAQYIHLVSNNSGGLPTDLWLPVTENVKPATSNQYTAGFAINLKKGYRMSIESYYKTMENLLEYKEGTSYFTTTNNWESTVTQGAGTAYGAEVLLEKKSGKLSGFIGYTLSYSNRKFDELNNGKEFPSKYDRRHDISVVGNYKFNDRINIGAVWVYGTGYSITLPTQRYAPLNRGAVRGWGLPTKYVPVDEFGNESKIDMDIIEYYGNKNNFKLTAYHRLDVSINLTKQKKKGIRVWSFGAYNVYNHQNPYMIYVKEVNGQNKLYQKSLFPVIPYLSYNYKF